MRYRERPRRVQSFVLVARIVVAACLAATAVLACGATAQRSPDVWSLDQLPPLTGGSVDDLTRVAAEQYADAHPDVYAGRFTSGGFEYVGFTNDAAGNLTALRARMTTDQWQVRAFTADFTYRELVQLRDRIFADQPWFRARGIELTAWGPDDLHNRETIRLSRLDPGWMAQISNRYGSRIVRFEQMGPAQAT